MKLSQPGHWGALIAVLLVSLTAGCSLVPGSHIPSPVGTGDNVVEPEQQAAIYPITPSLIRQLKQTATQGPEADRQPVSRPSVYDYRVQPGDVLNITVWDHPELTIPAGGERSAQEAGNLVHADGTIFYPYVGEVNVAGMNVSEIRSILIESLSNYIQSPQVDVTVAAFRSQSVYVTGEVEEPGMQPVTNVPLTLLEAITRAGGVTSGADWTNVTLTRNGKTIRYSLRDLYQHGKISQNVQLRPNDIVHVAHNQDAKVFVLGEVGDPKSISMGRSTLTLAEVLAETGGFSQATADASGIFVLRKAPEDSGRIADVYQLNARNAMALVLADQFELQKRDIVYVTAAPIARWNRIIAQILPTAQAVYFFSRVEDELTDTE
jgi:polysaccharide export outer membrane protein